MVGGSWVSTAVSHIKLANASGQNAGSTARPASRKNIGKALAGATLFLRDPGTYELATGKETVSHELARAEGA